MKTLIAFTTLFCAISAPVLAQTVEPKQTPDVLDDSDLSDFVRPPEAASSMSQVDEALLRSAFDGNLAQVELLIGKGAAVNLEGPKKRTPLILAASNGHNSVVEFLVSKGADVNASDSGGQTALTYACRRSFNETAAFLLEHGADVNAQSKKKGVTSLMLAAVSDNVDLVRLLLENEADPNLTDIFGRTAKLLAQKKGNTAVVELLPDPPAPSS